MSGFLFYKAYQGSYFWKLVKYLHVYHNFTVETYIHMSLIFQNDYCFKMTKFNVLFRLIKNVEAYIL